MASLTLSFPRKSDWQMAMIITRREVRDSFRDWRIIIPTVVLTIFFPALMNFTAGRMLNFVSEYGAEIIATQLIPFLLLVVGFFPMSFSLIIALETFVGEKERRSLEPLLASPLTNTQLYMGKVMASLIPPLFASYMGTAVYLLGLWLFIDWTPTWQLFLQTLLITTIQGVIMVAGAVIVSSQTTSVRAANLLASFIIVPMAILVQAEAAALFWGNHAGLWWLILALLITAVTLIRMGVRVFNREDLMGQEIDQLKLGLIGRRLWNSFTGRGEDGRYPNPLGWYRQTLAILPRLRLPIVGMLLLVVGGMALGAALAQRFPLPGEIQAQLTGERLSQNLAQLEVFKSALPGFIIGQNIRALLLQAVLGVFSFGLLALIIFMLPWGIIGYAAMQFVLAGESGGAFLLATVLPHASVELPALLIAGAAAWRWHVTIISPPPDRSLSEGFLLALADFARLFVGVVIPLLIVAALLESYLTPLVLAAVYGGA